MSRRRLVCTAAALAVGVGGYVHLVLYRRSYHAIPRVGVLFALDVVIAAGAATALLVRSDRSSVVAALAHSAAAVAGFAFSRTVGLLGFKETGLDPAPHAVIALAAELCALTLLAWVATQPVHSPATDPRSAPR